MIECERDADIYNNDFKNIGLDPSLPLFRMATDDKKLNEEDAKFVDVLNQYL